MSISKELYIGTSGYNYNHWRGGVFYPEGLKSGEYLKFYAQRFNAVELNVTFYRLPSKKVFEGWHRRSPGDFKFVVKGNRFITHIKRFKDIREPLENFTENVAALRGKVNCILWQLPPGFKADEERLKNFIESLHRLKFLKLVRHVFEFRHETWFTEEIYKILRSENLCLCIADLPDIPRSEVLTADFIYIRFHGSKERYSSNYSDTELKGIASKAKQWLQGRKALYAFFNNDAYGYAPKNAISFRGFLSRQL